MASRAKVDGNVKLLKINSAGIIGQWQKKCGCNTARSKKHVGNIEQTRER